MIDVSERAVDLRMRRFAAGIKMTESYRMYASISFVGVLIIVGMPLWWKTTEVYRVSLPYSRIENLENLPIRISVNVQVVSKDLNSATVILQHLKKKFTVSDLYDLKLEASVLPKSFNGTDEAIVSNEKGVGTLQLIEWPELETDVYVTSFRTVFFSSKSSVSKLVLIVKEWLLAVDTLRSAVAAMSTAATVKRDAAGRRRVPPSKAFDISLSVAVPNPDKIKVIWEPQQVLEQYVQPFVEELSFIHNFTLKSQWLYFVQLNFNPKQVLDDTALKRHYSLPQDVLPHLITPLEKKLASHISKNPCLNFVLYIPACEQAPIHIYDKSGVRVNGKMDAFLSPRWGGVVIGNAPEKICIPYLNEESQDVPVYKPPTKDIMGYFLSQLRLLLGIQNQQHVAGVDVQSMTTLSPRKWEFDALVRIRTIEQVHSAKLTLQSLSQLLGEISNIVINDDVGASIYNAVENVELTIDYLKRGMHLEALASSREAFLSAEAAFTDPSLLALLYFPDDQKYAVYIPLFLPVMIPVIISFKNIWSWIKGRSQKDKTE